MSGQLTCPRCSAPTRPPGLWSDAWMCPAHGAVHPLHPPVVTSDEVLRAIGEHATVPLWAPRPLPPGWLVTGARTVGDQHSGTVATVLACSGPNPLAGGGVAGRQADLLLVAETPGTGLGAHLAGLPDVDPGSGHADGPPHLKLVVAGHPAPLWALGVERPAGPAEPAGPVGSAGAVGAAGPDGADGPDGVAGPVGYVGEAAGVWLWVLVWPATAAAVLLEGFELVDLRDPARLAGLAYGALSPRLVETSSSG